MFHLEWVSSWNITNIFSGVILTLNTEIEIDVEIKTVLPLRIVKSNVSSVGPSSERNMLRRRRACAQNVNLYYPYR